MIDKFLYVMKGKPNVLTLVPRLGTKSALIFKILSQYVQCIIMVLIACDSYKSGCSLLWALGRKRAQVFENHCDIMSAS